MVAAGYTGGEQRPWEPWSLEDDLNLCRRGPAEFSEKSRRSLISCNRRFTRDDFRNRVNRHYELLGQPPPVFDKFGEVKVNLARALAPDKSYTEISVLINLTHSQTYGLCTRHDIVPKVKRARANRGPMEIWTDEHREFLIQQLHSCPQAQTMVARINEKFGTHRTVSGLTKQIKEYAKAGHFTIVSEFGTPVCERVYSIRFPGEFDPFKQGELPPVQEPPPPPAMSPKGQALMSMSPFMTYEESIADNLTYIAEGVGLTNHFLEQILDQLRKPR